MLCGLWIYNRVLNLQLWWWIISIYPEERERYKRCGPRQPATGKRQLIFYYTSPKKTGSSFRVRGILHRGAMSLLESILTTIV